MATLEEYVGTKVRFTYCRGPVSQYGTVNRVEGDHLVVRADNQWEVRVSPLWPEETVGGSPLVADGSDEYDTQADPLV